MKLYAQIDSERASKGQGGNEHLTIRIFGEAKGKKRIYETIAEMSLVKDGEKYNLTLDNYAEGVITFDQFPKKGYEKKCSICGEDIYGVIQVHHHNEACGKCGYMIISTQDHNCDGREIKGKQQKGE